MSTFKGVHKVSIELKAALERQDERRRRTAATSASALNDDSNSAKLPTRPPRPINAVCARKLVASIFETVSRFAIRTLTFQSPTRDELSDLTAKPRRPRRCNLLTNRTTVVCQQLSRQESWTCA